jgi:hypothetical protein
MDDPVKWKNSMEKLNFLRDTYAQTENFPVWPFNNKSVRKYFSVVISSIIPGILSALVNLNKIFIAFNTLTKHFIK